LPNYYYDLTESYQLAQAMMRSRDAGTLQVVELRISDRLPDNMSFVEGSASPEPSSYDSQTADLTWQFDSVPTDGVTITFAVEPQQVGEWPTNLRAAGVFTDSKGGQGAFEFAVPYVTVFEPATEPTPEMTASPSPSPSPTPVDGLVVATLYLPISHSGGN
jgi:hypothetical protein